MKYWKLQARAYFELFYNPGSSSLGLIYCGPKIRPEPRLVPPLVTGITRDVMGPDLRVRVGLGLCLPRHPDSEFACPLNNVGHVVFHRELGFGLI